MDCSTPGLALHHQLPEFTQTHVHWVSDAIQPSHPLSFPLLLLSSIIPSNDKSRWHIKKQRHHFAYKGPYCQSYGFPSGHVQMWELDHKEGWAQNWCFWTVVLKKTLESPLNWKEIQPVHPKGNQSWIFTGRTIDLTIWTFVDKVISLLFNTLSRFVIGFFPRSKHLLTSWLQSLSAVILEPKKIKSATVSTFSPFFAMKWWAQMPWS